MEYSYTKMTKTFFDEHSCGNWSDDADTDIFVACMAELTGVSILKTGAKNAHPIFNAESELFPNEKKTFFKLERHRC